jgi:AraC-like DNA-binding protein
MFSNHLLFFFAALGSFNGLALSLYLLITGFASAAQRWLAILILMVSIRTGKSVALFFLADTPSIVIQVGLTACFFIGPCLYFFVRRSLSSTTSLGFWERYHLLLTGVVAMFVNLMWPYAHHASLWHGAIVQTISWLWFAYLLMSSVLLTQQRHRLPTANARRLLLTVVAGLWIIWLAYFTSGYTSYIVGALSFSFVLYLCLIVAWGWRHGQAPVEPYQNRRIDTPEAVNELQALANLMSSERLFLDPLLSLPRLSRRLGIPQARLSQLLNDNNGTTFKQYLTGLRLAEAQHLLLQIPQLPLESIAEAAGFQSMSTFYAAFKKANGCTPSVYREQNQTPETGFRTPETLAKTLI